MSLTQLNEIPPRRLTARQILASNPSFLDLPVAILTDDLETKLTAKQILSKQASFNSEDSLSQESSTATLCDLMMESASKTSVSDVKTKIQLVTAEAESRDSVATLCSDPLVVHKELTSNFTAVEPNNNVKHPVEIIALKSCFKSTECLDSEIWKASRSVHFDFSNLLRQYKCACVPTAAHAVYCVHGKLLLNSCMGYLY
ncbi:hypothetical protein HDU98_010381 [Podochytrium sp. JEL0797]|nr:hypothetical protein HDU98_010381 [Podochytrium sp. JEL0797]